MSTALTGRVLQILRQAGLEAVEAYPGRKMPQLSAPCAAVQLQQAELSTREARVLVTVVSPGNLGGNACQDTAAAAAAALQGAGADCLMAGCSFDGAMGCFCADVQANFHGYQPDGSWEPGMVVTIGDIHRPHAVSAVFWRATDEDTTVLANAQWHFRLEEQFPPGVVEEADPGTPFVMLVHYSGRTEQLTGCVFKSQRRENGPLGTRQVREGTAAGFYMTVQ